MMTGVEISGLDDGWRETEKVHEMFCKRIMGAPTAAANGACVKELGRTNRKEKVLERKFKYWERLLEMEESSLSGDALIYQREERENNWICGIKRELEKLDMGYMWRRGRENDRNSWKMVSQRCVDIERQGMDTTMREKKSLILLNSLKRDWQKEDYTSITT
jgi:hypothetical protein